MYLAICVGLSKGPGQRGWIAFLILPIVIPSCLEADLLAWVLVCVTTNLICLMVSFITSHEKKLDFSLA